MTIEEIQAEIERRGVHPQVGPAGEGHDIQQNAWEFAHFAVAMQELGVTSVLEIGTGPNAGLARFMHEYLQWTVTSVDNNGSWVSWDGIEFIVSNDRINFGDRRFDLLIIDGNHAYEFVRGDHEWYGKYATKAVMFHDIGGLRGCEDVKRYWDEVKNEYPQFDIRVFHEIIAENEQCVGIGWFEDGRRIIARELVLAGLEVQRQIENGELILPEPVEQPKHKTRKKAAK